MRLLEKICEEMGVELWEIWQGNDGFKYCILEDGSLERFEGTDFEGFEDDISRLLTGELKPMWKPRVGEEYYVPSIHNKETIQYDNFYWQDDEFDRWWLENNLVFKTEEEAIEATNKMIEFAKRGFQYG